MNTVTRVDRTGDRLTFFKGPGGLHTHFAERRFNRMLEGEELLLRVGIHRARGLIAAVSTAAENVYTVLSARVLRRVTRR